MARNSFPKLVRQIATQRTIEKNSTALELFDVYKETSDIIERVEMASGKNLAFKADTGSTLNFEINPHAVRSTTAQEI